MLYPDVTRRHLHDTPHDTPRDTFHDDDRRYVLYPDEGHGFARPENRVDFNARAEAFLSAHLDGGRAEPFRATPGASATFPLKEKEGARRSDKHERARALRNDEEEQATPRTRVRRTR